MRPIKALFRKQPLLATALTAGAVDGLMGAVDDRVTLAVFGFAVATGALSLRWWQLQRVPAKLPERPAVVFLKDSTPDEFYALHPADPDKSPRIYYSDSTE